MDVSDTIKNILIVNLYWFTLPIIGYAFLRYVSSQKKEIFGLLYLAKYIIKQHAFVIFIYSFATYFALISLLSIPLYLVHAPAVVASIIYVVFLVMAIVYLLVLFIKNMYYTKTIDPFKLSGLDLYTKIIFTLLVVILVSDFFLAMYIKAFYAGDAVFHLSRIVDIIAYGFNVNSPHHSSLPEAAYHYNAVYTLYIPLSQLGHIPPFTIWEYSLSFFRLLQWAAIFTLAMHITEKLIGLKRGIVLLSSSFSILAIMLMAGAQFIATYPSMVVVLWLILLVITISLHERQTRGFKYTIPVISLMIALTHPTYSLIALLFIIFYLFSKGILFKGIKIRETYVYLISIVILSIPPIISYLVPGDLNETQQSIFRPVTITIFGQFIKRPFTYETGISLLTGILLVFSFIGLSFLIYKQRARRSQFALLLSLTLFFPVIVFNPLVYSRLSSILPFWLIERFSQMNVLVLLSAGIGVYAITVLTGHIIHNNKVINRAPIITSIVLLALSPMVAYGTYSYLFVRGSWNQYGYTVIDTSFEQLSTLYRKSDLVVTDPERSFFLPSILPVDILAVEDGHSTKAADTTNRLICQKEIMTNLRYQDLQYIGADYIEIPNERVGDLMISQNNLKSVATVQELTIFKFTKTRATLEEQEVTQACIDYMKNENYQ